MMDLEVGVLENMETEILVNGFKQWTMRLCWLFLRS